MTRGADDENAGRFLVQGQPDRHPGRFFKSTLVLLRS